MRNDIHRPSAIIPADYEFVACEHTHQGDYGDLLVSQTHRRALAEHKARTGGKHCEHKGDSHNCDVCGSVNLLYGLIYYHGPSNEYVRVGADCAAKLDLGGLAAFARFKRDFEGQREAIAGKRKAQRILGEAGLSKAYEIFDAQDRAGFVWEENTITDIVGKLVQYGSVSEKQIAFVGRLIEKIEGRAVKAAARAAENAAAADCPTGRLLVKGTVVTLKEQDGDWGLTLKMLVRADEGFKVWATCPEYGTQRGDRVSFNITLTPSRDDPKFGFGSRPAKFERQPAPVEVAQ